MVKLRVDVFGECAFCSDAYVPFSNIVWMNAALVVELSFTLLGTNKFQTHITIWLFNIAMENHNF
jgi:hypothetical protein